MIRLLAHSLQVVSLSSYVLPVELSGRRGGNGVSGRGAESDDSEKACLSI
jgi:hypothetical protein